MDDWGIWLSVGSAAIALFSLIFTLIKYRKHEKRLNEQQAIINEYRLKKMRAEETASLKADIKGNICRRTKSSDQLKVFNNGQANATNIRIEIIGPQDGLMVNQIEPIELLNPQNEYSYEIFLEESHVNTLKIKYTWDDDFGKNRENIEHLQVI